MRLFIAIELSPEIRNSLAQLQEQLKKVNADIKWVQPQNIHLTLKFLGEVEEKKIEDIQRILETVAEEKTSFPLRLSCLGAFPKTSSPRVVWVGIAQGEAETKKIAQGLEERLTEIGIPKEERPFSSHITLGRVRSGLNRQDLAKRLQGLASDLNLECLVTKIALFKSTLTPKGPIYEIIKQVNLKAN